MPLQTSGFQLSQFERAPQVPSNIGIVDTKSIYGSVVDALKSFEAVRSVQQAQKAADAEYALAADKAQAEQALLGPESEARRLKAQLFAAGAPYEMAAIPDRAAAERAKNILSTEKDIAERAVVTPKAEAEVSKFEADKVTSDLLKDPEIAKRILQLKNMTPAQKLREDNLRVLNDPTQPHPARQAAAISLGIEPKAVQPGISYQVMTDSNGTPRLIATDTRGIGAYDIASGTGIGTLVGGPNAPRTQVPYRLPAGVAPTGGAAINFGTQGTPPAGAVTPAAPAGGAPAAPAGGVQTPAEQGLRTPTVQQAPVVMTDRTWLGQSVSDKAAATEIAQIKGDMLKKLPSLEATIRDMEGKVKRGEEELARAESLISNWSTGMVGNWLKNLGGTDAKDLVELLKPIKTNIFIDELARMRANSPTGGALGNVSDTEGNKLEATLGSLDTSQSKGQLIDNIENVRKARRETLENMKRTLEQYKSYLQGFGAGAGASGAPAARSAFEEAAARYR